MKYDEFLERLAEERAKCALEPTIMVDGIPVGLVQFKVRGAAEIHIFEKLYEDRIESRIEDLEDEKNHLMDRKETLDNEIDELKSKLKWNKKIRN